MFQSPARQSPTYFADDCRLLSLTDRHLPSADIRTCVVPRTNTLVGAWRFSASGPKYGTVCRLHSEAEGFSFAEV